MGEGYLEPVVTKLEGDIANLDAKLTEALALMKAFGDKAQKQQKDQGTKAGKDAGEALMAAYSQALKDGQKDLPDFGKVLETQINHAKTVVRDLGTELRKTGSIDVFQKLRTAEKDLKQLETLGKDMADALATGLKDGEQNFSAALQGLMKNAITGAPVIAALVAAIVVASPLIISSFGGALLAGIAGAGIGAAIAAQIHNPVVSTAFDNLKNEGIGVLKAATEPLVGVFSSSLNKFTDLIGKSEEPLQHAFEELAPYVSEVVDSFINFLHEAAPGFLQFLHQAGPVLDQMAAALPGLGHDFGVMFTEIGNGSAGAGQGLHDLIHLIGILVAATGGLIEVFSKGYEIFSGISDLFDGKYAQGWLKINGSTQQANEAQAKLSDTAQDVTNHVKQEADAVDKLNKALDDLINKNLTADQAQIKQKQSVSDLTAAIAENGRNWDINTDAGRKNEQALLDAISASEAKRDADIANGKDAVQAAQDYNQEVQALLAIAQKAGDTKAALQALAGKYEVDVSQFYTTHFINEGTPPSEFWHGLSQGGAVLPGGIIKAASGLMPARNPGTLVLAGEPETGGEWLIPRRGISQQRAAQLIGDAAADHGLMPGGSGGLVHLTVPVSIDGKTFVTATYETFVNFGQERKNRRGSTGFN